jgi:hypothetical protein
MPPIIASLVYLSSMPKKYWYKKVSLLFIDVETGLKNIGQFNAKPYNSSKKLFRGLLALKLPITI